MPSETVMGHFTQVCVQTGNDSGVCALVDGFIAELIAGYWLVCQGRDQRSVGLSNLGCWV